MRIGKILLMAILGISITSGVVHAGCRQNPKDCVDPKELKIGGV